MSTSKFPLKTSTPPSSSESGSGSPEQYSLPQAIMSSSERFESVLPKTAVVIRLPKMFLHWKKKKKMPKNLTTIASGSDPSSLANLKMNWEMSSGNF